VSGAGSLARPTLRTGQLTWMRSPVLWGVALFVVAAAFRLYGLDDGHSDPYYDAAVRSMGLSWHNFFFAAFEPGGGVAIDKPPLDLWLQVASTKAFGFNLPALLLPQALAGSGAAALVYDLVRRPFGMLGGIVAGLTLAMLPMSVVTSRSDTMDSLMMALTVLALWLAARSVERGKARYLYAGGFVAGLAFEVKLLEALIALPALVVLYALASSEPRRRRARNLLVAGLVFLVSAAWWPLAVTLAPGHKPYALGSTDGSFLNATFVYNGTNRVLPQPLSRHHQARALGTSPRGPLRLLDSQRSRFFQAIGFALAGAAALAALAVALSIGRGATRQRRALGWALAAWLVPGALVLSAMTTLHPRYVEAISPAVAAALGASFGALALRRPRPWIALGAGAAVVALCLGYAAQRSVVLVQRNASDSGHVGTLPSVNQLSAYLAPRTRGLPYEVVSDTFAPVGPLIVHDARPVLIATGTYHHVMTPLAKIRAEVAAGHVRYALFADNCGKPHENLLTHCSAAGRWMRLHGTDVSLAAGAGSRGVLFALHP
jgi:4-amino-4-deoxy-L-arabinose transferase-like glycosyltransferase